MNASQTHEGLGGLAKMEPNALAQALTRRLGPHPATQLGLDLQSARGREAWLLAATLLGTRAGEEAVMALLQTLHRDGLLEATSLIEHAEELSARLASGPWQDSHPLAARLLRVAKALAEGGGVESIESEADGLEMLGGGIARLAPGLGAATVLRFLRPLREIWPDAAEVPATPAALTAAACLGWVAEAAEGLRFPPDSGAPAADLEAALERLGAVACRRRVARCPLIDACPRL